MQKKKEEEEKAAAEEAERLRLEDEEKAAAAEKAAAEQLAAVAAMQKKKEEDEKAALDEAERLRREEEGRAEAEKAAQEKAAAEEAERLRALKEAEDKTAAEKAAADEAERKRKEEEETAAAEKAAAEKAAADKAAAEEAERQAKLLAEKEAADKAAAEKAACEKAEADRLWAEKEAEAATERKKMEQSLAEQSTALNSFLASTLSSAADVDYKHQPDVIIDVMAQGSEFWLKRPTAGTWLSVPPLGATRVFSASEGQLASNKSVLSSGYLQVDGSSTALQEKLTFIKDPPKKRRRDLIISRCPETTPSQPWLTASSAGTWLSVQALPASTDGSWTNKLFGKWASPSGVQDSKASTLMPQRSDLPLQPLGDLLPPPAVRNDPTSRKIAALMAEADRYEASCKEAERGLESLRSDNDALREEIDRLLALGSPSDTPIVIRT
jgi:chemotaxis protein histidine kinase CheA